MPFAKRYKLKDAQSGIEDRRYSKDTLVLTQRSIFSAINQEQLIKEIFLDIDNLLNTINFFLRLRIYQIISIT